MLALVPPDDDGDGGGDQPSDAEAEPSSDPAPTAAGCRFRWAQLLARVFGHQVLTRPSCGHARAIIAGITDRDVAAKLLAHLGLPTAAPELLADDDWPVA